MRAIEGDLPTAGFYADFAEHEAVDSPVFRAWAQGVAQDGEVLALLGELPEAKRQPNLVFAAARWHGADTAEPRYEALREVLASRWAAVRATIESRSTQTNEAGRCATLLPELARIEGPVALLEVGAAAGLCLLPDRYSYEFTVSGPAGPGGPPATDGSSVRLDPVDGPSPVVLECALTGIEPPTRLPDVVWRGGLDLNPLDVGDDDAMAWLETLVWPGHEARRERLRAAVGVARGLARGEALHLRRGDLAEDLPALVAEARAAVPGATVVVQHSAVLAYCSAEVRERFAEVVQRQADVWLANEGSSILPGMPEPERRPAFVLARDGRAVAFTQPHGAWAWAV
ncbi:DUF2332 domain-containing protein [Kytococcus sedentarius]|uniref:DUF2332 domain-containing protein n=1 Tax=Kytococcus sedentarius TaxID=1276 RepID=UPI0035BC4F82